MPVVLVRTNPATLEMSRDRKPGGRSGAARPTPHGTLAASASPRSGLVKVVAT